MSACEGCKYRASWDARFGPDDRNSPRCPWHDFPARSADPGGYMTKVTPLHKYYFEAHLLYVSAEMRRLGPPTLRGYFDPVSGAWFLREGTHRIRAAHALGVAPRLVSISWWRSRKSLERARFAAREYGLSFARVDHAL